MRIISQDKTIDVPYDNVVLTIEPTSFKESKDVDVYAKYFDKRYHMATYDSMDKAVGIMKDIYSSFDNKKYYTMYTM